MFKQKWLMVVMTGLLAFSLAACSGTDKTSGGNSKKEQKEYKPEKAISIMAPSGAGGGIDTAARIVAKLANEKGLVDQPITVENKPGGGQVLGTTEFATQEVGNDTKLMLASTPFVLNFIKGEGTATVSFRDVTPLARLQVDYGVLAVKADSKYKDLKSLMDAIKADPTSLTVSGGGAPGTWDYLNAILVADSYGIDGKKVKYTAYDGGSEAVTALLGGNADVLTSDLSSVAEYLKSGDVRVLGISSTERITGEYSNIPTYKEQGFDVVKENWRGLYGPKDMSKEASGRLN
ncbi:Bug family tripartite tricarboxylate transporter substrate binding protein [Neobacillus bataviensis]|uniref:Bug family tripartite tricarboxylate transporter substrate binding protein n=1 Tax=Neobacillus bataviensis TaxID=220685 RepID=UPI001CBC6062|nr:tripartite tricarboxylate transporter substrate-binding protein [Neobacillus bataviensis]